MSLEISRYKSFPFFAAPRGIHPWLSQTSLPARQLLFLVKVSPKQPHTEPNQFYKSV
jgi:hypothetical protein